MSNELETLDNYSIKINDYNPNAFCLIRLELDEQGKPEDWTFLYCNDALARLEGKPKEELIGHRFFDIFPDGNRKWLKYYYKAAYEGKPTSFDELSEEIDQYLRIDANPIGQKGLCTCTIVDVKKELYDREQIIASIQSTDPVIEEYLEAERKRTAIDAAHQRVLAESYRKLDEMNEILSANKMGTWAIYLLDGKEPTMEADAMMQELLGISTQDLTPKEVYNAWFSNIVPDSVQSVLDSVDKMKTNGSDENTYLWNHPVLGERYVRCGGTANAVSGGFMLRGYHYDVDDVVREQQQKDEAIREQFAIFDALADNYTNVYLIDLELETLKVLKLNGYLTTGVDRQTGVVYPYEVVKSQYVNERVHPEDVAMMHRAIGLESVKNAFALSNEYSGNYRVISEGETHHYQYKYIKLKDFEYVIAGFQCIDHIVEEHLAQQKRERELEEAYLRDEKEHNDIIKSLSNIYSTIIKVEIDTHHYEVVNSVALMDSVAGKAGDFDEAKESILAAFMAPDMQERMSEFLDFDTLAERLQDVNTIAIDYKAPSDQWVQARFVVKLRDENGVAKEALYVVRDITKEKTIELAQQENLTHALAAAQQANRAKTTFLNSMSHDIRTPMNAIIGFTALAQTHIDETAQVQDYLSKISTSSTHLLSLINDILDMSRIESGTVKLEEKAVHIPDLLHDLRTMIQGLVNSKNLNLFIDTQDVVNEDVLTDKLRLNQVLLNIVSNAVKFTQPGGDVIIRLVEKPCSLQHYTTYEFSVKDNGIGMSEEFLEHIFETFTREYSATVSGIQGTGLGMAITKNIVDMMGGDIKVESEEGKGSIFTVTLNLHLANEPVKNEPIPDLLGARALIVDDDINTCRGVSKMLRDIEMRPDWTVSGKEAIIRAQDASEMNDEYKVYIIDYLMPDMNGIETVRRIRKVISEEVPIIVLTAYDWADFEYEAREAGVTAFVSKPIFMSELREVLTQPVTSDSASQQDNQEREYDYSGKHILLVEDNELNREIAIAILEETGMTIDSVEDGDEAVAAINREPADKYDLILMDVQMPRMDGYTATREIRTLADNKKANIPIVAMTANAFEEDKQKAYKAGMNGHIIKPISIDEIAKVLDEIFATNN